MTEKYIDFYFPDAPIMHDIARCESGYSHVTVAGAVVENKVTHDFGIFQISRKYWGSFSESLGFDIYSLQGNIRMARYLYDLSGTDPWLPSKSCWSKPSKIARL